MACRLVATNIARLYLFHMLQRILPAGFIAPCLPTKTDKLPSGSQWLHEIKHDGFRIIARKTGAQVRLYSRPGNDLTRRFPLIVETGGTVETQSHLLKFAFDRGVAEEAFMRTIPLAFIAFAALSLSTTGARAADGSWCANYGTGHSGINCTYTSQQQCLASVSGVYGFCTPNPYPGTGYGRGGSWNLPPSGRARGNRND